MGPPWFPFAKKPLFIVRTKGHRMHLRLKSVVASLVTTGMVAGMLAFIIVPAAQAATPPWEPDPSARGNVVFYDATGHVVTGGSIDDSPVAAFVQAAAPGRSTDNTATQFGFLAQPGVATGSWPGEQMSAGNAYPVSIPNNPPSNNPTVAGSPGEESLRTLATDFP